MNWYSLNDFGFLTKVWKYSTSSNYYVIENTSFNGKKCISKESKFCLVCCLALFVLLIIFYKYLTFTSLVEDYLSTIEMTAVTIQNIGFIMFTNFKREEIADVFTKIFYFKQNLVLLRNHPVETKNNIGKFLISYFILRLIFLVITMFSFLCFREKTYKHLLYIFCLYTQLTYQPILEISIFFFVFTLEELHVQWNNILKNKNYISENSRLLMDRIWDLSTNINKTVNFIFILKSLPDFAFLADDIYFGVWYQLKPGGSPRSKSSGIFIYLAAITLGWVFLGLYFNMKVLSAFENIVQKNYEISQQLEDTVTFALNIFLL